MDSLRFRRVLMALGVLVFAVVVGQQSSEIPSSAIYAQVGPTTFPYVVAVGLGLLGLMLLHEAVTGIWATGGEDDDLPPDRKALSWLLGGLVMNVLLIDFIGFMLASTLMFACTTRAFGSRKWIRDSAIGLAVAVIAWVSFEKLLGIQVSAGFLETML